MAEKDRILLKSDNDTLFPDNTTQDITPAKKRQFDQDMIDSNLNITTTDPQSIASPVDLTPQTSVPAHTEGRTYYDDATHALAYHNDMSGTVVNVGQETLLRVHNNTGVTVTKGQSIFIGAVVGTIPSVILSKADLFITAFSNGMATHDILDGEEGFVADYGIIEGLDTSSFTSGMPAYVSDATAGELAAQRPAISSPVGIVLVSDAVNGSILCNPVGVLNIAALTQATLSATSPPITQVVTTTPEPLVGFSNTPGPEIRMITTFTQDGTHYRAQISPATSGDAGFFNASFSIAVESTSNIILSIEIYINGSPSGVLGVVDMRNSNTDGGSASVAAITTEIIDETEDVELYVYVNSGTSTITYGSLVYGMNKIGVS